MKLVAFFIMFLICLSGFGQERRPAVHWETIPGLVSNKGNVFIDRSSFTIEKDNHHKYVSATILFVPNTPMQIKFNNKNMTVSSFVRVLIVSCNDKVMSPSVDLFFDVKMPERTTKPLGGINYPGSAGTAPIEDTSSIYKRFCDPYI